ARGTNDGVKEMIEEHEAVGVSPQEGHRIAIHMSHHQLTKLFALERRISRRLAIADRHSFFGKRVLVVMSHEVFVQRKLASNRNVRMADARYVRWIQRHGFSFDIND